MKLKKLLATSVAAVAGFALLVPLAACGDDDDDGYVDNTGEELTAVESSEAAEKLSDIISTMQNSTNASLTISETNSSGETESYAVKLLKTGSNLYADETMRNGEESDKSYIRDGVFYYYDMSSSTYGVESYDRGTGYMIYDTIDNMYYNFWSADLDKLCTEEILRAYFTDSYYETYVDTYGIEYVKSMFKSAVIYNNTVYTARLWTAREFGSWTEMLKQLQELMAYYGEDISAEASTHRYEATFTCYGWTYSISLTDGAALRSSDFASLDSLIDDEICYVSENSASSLSALKNGGSATLNVEGSGYLGDDLDENYYGKRGVMSFYSNYLYATYNGVRVPVSEMYEYDYVVYQNYGSEYAKYSNVTGYLTPDKNAYNFNDGAIVFASSTLNSVNSGESKSFDIYIYDGYDLAGNAATWLSLCGVIDSESEMDESSLSLGFMEIGFSYFYSQTEQTDDGYYYKMIRFYTYVICDF